MFFTAGQGRYYNEQGVQDTDSHYLNFLFGTLISFDMECFDYKGLFYLHSK